MPRSAGQSDFVVRRDEPVDLPEAELRSREASAGATKWILRLTFLLLALFALLLAVGPHIPSGE